VNGHGIQNGRKARVASSLAIPKLIQCNRQNSQNKLKTWTFHEALMGCLDSNSSMLLPLPQPSPISPPPVVVLPTEYLNDPIKPTTHRYATSSP